MSKYGIFLKNSQNTAWQTELWFHFIYGKLKEEHTALVDYESEVYPQNVLEDIEKETVHLEDLGKEIAEVVLSCWIDTDSDAERLNVRLGKPL